MAILSDVQKKRVKVTSKSYVKKYCWKLAAKIGIQKWHAKVMYKRDTQKGPTKAMFKSDVGKLCSNYMFLSDVHKWHPKVTWSLRMSFLLLLSPRRKGKKYKYKKKHGHCNLLTKSANQIVEWKLGNKFNPSPHVKQVSSLRALGLFH